MPSHRTLRQLPLFVGLLVLTALVSRAVSTLALALLPAFTSDDRMLIVMLQPVAHGMAIAIFSLAMAGLLGARSIAPGRTRLLGLNRKPYARAFVGVAVTCMVFAAATWGVGVFASKAAWVDFRLFGAIAISLAGAIATTLSVRNARH